MPVDGPVKKVMMIDAKKAHLNPRCKEDVYIELPPEGGAEPGQCGKLNFWLYGFRKAASAWEEFYAEVKSRFSKRSRVLGDLQARRKGSYWCGTR